MLRKNLGVLLIVLGLFFSTIFMSQTFVSAEEEVTTPPTAEESIIIEQYVNSLSSTPIEESPDPNAEPFETVPNETSNDEYDVFPFPSKDQPSNVVIGDGSTTYYPGTSLKVYPGDILISSKSTVTAFVGHAAIVGPDYKVKEVLTSGAQSTTLSSFNTRHGSTAIKVYRTSNTATGYNAAKWASNNLYKVTSYDWTFTKDLDVISSNYCSKYVWQAYDFGAGANFNGALIYRYPNNFTVTPYSLRDGAPISYKGSF